jgi:hypothetical protein
MRPYRLEVTVSICQDERFYDEEFLGNIPVTNLKGLVSRSSSDILASSDRVLVAKGV